MLPPHIVKWGRGLAHELVPVKAEGWLYTLYTHLYTPHHVPGKKPVYTCMPFVLYTPCFWEEYVVIEEPYFDGEAVVALVVASGPVGPI